MNLIETALEILKYTVPALIVYLLLRQFLKHQAYAEEVKRRSKLKNDTLLLRFQAYERLVLFCERIRLSNLIVRLNNQGMSTVGLKNAILVSIQKEFEHNLTQQLYISGQLWEMVELFKDQTIASITSGFIEHEKEGVDRFINDLLSKDQILEKNFGSKVKVAIKKEVELFFQ